MAGKLIYTLVVRHPDTLVGVPLIAGSEVPDWATDLVDKGNLDDGGSSDGDDGAEKPYAKRKKPELEKLVAERNEGREGEALIVVEGKGTVADLAAALDADDVALAAAEKSE